MNQESNSNGRLPHATSSTPPVVDTWNQKFQSWYEQAYRIAYGLVYQQVKDPQLVDEQVSTALTKAWEQGAAHPDYFQSLAHFTRWCAQTAQWRAIDVLRQRGRRQPLPDDFPERLDAPSPEQDGNAKAQKIAEVLALLPEEERHLLMKYYKDEMTDQQIGDELFGSTGTAGARAQRARRLRLRIKDHLRKLFLEQGIDPADWEGGWTNETE